MSTLHILWDESYIWGLLAARAARSMNLPHRLLKATDIQQGILQSERPEILFVPGGNARHKADRLGATGLEAIREYVNNGGFYLGFCGGAGLALNHQDGLGLCPWQRGRYQERLQHFMSGHLVVDLAQERGSAKNKFYPDEISSWPKLPVWWPGQFEAGRDDSVQILARYARPAKDFWLADLPIDSLPEETFATWKDMYGIEIDPDFLSGQPCVVAGEFGAGSYILSYSHLETPDSGEANAWLAHIFQEKLGVAPACSCLPVWDLNNSPCHWQDEIMALVDQRISEVVSVGLAQGLLFERNPWLLGWRTGIPGALVHNLWTAIKTIREFRPGPEAVAFWHNHSKQALELSEIFAKACTHYLMAERLSMTLSKSLPDALPQEILKKQRVDLFGAPMCAGGVYLELMQILDELAFLQQSYA